MLFQDIQRLVGDLSVVLKYLLGGFSNRLFQSSLQLPSTSDSRRKMAARFPLFAAYKKHIS